MREIEKQLQKWKVAPYEEDELQATIEHVKQIVKELPTPKYEINHCFLLTPLLRFHMAKTALIQIILCGLILAYGISTQNQTTQLTDMTAILISFTSFVCMCATCLELLRSSIMGMWELERPCRLTPQRLLLYKILFMGCLSLGMILLSGCILAQYGTASIWALFLYGFLPFLSITGILLLFASYMQSKEWVIGAYAIALILYVVFLQLLQELLTCALWVQFLCVLMAIGFFVYAIHKFQILQEQGMGSTLI